MTSHAPLVPDPSRLKGQVAVITGASRGLGAGLARRFAEYEMSLGLCARSVPDPPPGVETVCAAVDVTDAAAVEAFANAVVATLGPIDLWVNNAGVLDPMGPQRDHLPADVERALLVNIGGVANGTRSFTSRARLQGDGSRTLVNVSSGASTSVYEGWSIYGATKAAVDHFTEIVAVEEPLVGCWAVAPGVVDTDMQAAIRSHDQSTFPAIERFRQLSRDKAWNSTEWVADHLLAIHTGHLVPETVVYRVPSESA